MTNEWIPVVSDAVKIGLGAFIAGLFTLLGTVVAIAPKLQGRIPNVVVKQSSRQVRRSAL